MGTGAAVPGGSSCDVGTASALYLNGQTSAITFPSILVPGHVAKRRRRYSAEPRVRRVASYPGLGANDLFDPERVGATVAPACSHSFRVRNCSRHLTVGTTLRVEPTALSCNAFGVFRASAGAFQIQRQQPCQQLVVRQIRRPAVGGKDHLIQTPMRIRQPGRASPRLCNTPKALQRCAQGSTRSVVPWVLRKQFDRP